MLTPLIVLLPGFHPPWRCCPWPLLILLVDNRFRCKEFRVFATYSFKTFSTFCLLVLGAKY
jgi:hypothetical protein